MKNKLLASFGAAAAVLLLAAPAVGQFQKFVTVGDSLVAGEESGCVIDRFEKRSWAAIVASQLGVDFQQPQIQELPLSNPFTGSPCLGATFDGTSISVGFVSQTGANENALLSRPYDNLGFNGSPHIRDFVDLKVTVPGRSDLDNKASVVLRNCAGCPFEGMSAVDEANSLSPDLVGLWAGNNDALDAMGVAVAIEGVTLTPVPAFALKYQQVVDELANADLDYVGPTIVAFNIPDISGIPFATTIPPVVVNPTTRQPVLVDGHTVPLLGPGNAAYPCPLTVLPSPNAGCSLPPGTLVTLGAASLLAQGIGVPVELGGTGLPLPDGSFEPPATLHPGVLLYPDEVAAISDHIAGYNAAIAATVTSSSAILVDMNAIFDRARLNGYSIGGITVTTSFLTGGIFSYDGVHPSAIGYGIIAQAFIKTLNAAKGTAIPEPNISSILFTPNISPFAAASSADEAGFWHYSLETWKRMLTSMVLPYGVQIAMPAGPRQVVALAPESPRPVDRATRVVSRDQPD